MLTLIANKNPIMLTIIGTLTLIISGWAGARIYDHEKRIANLETSYGSVEVLLKEIKRGNSADHTLILNWITRLDERLEARR